MTAWQFIVVFAAGALLSGFTFYWIGKDSGEKSVRYYIDGYDRVLIELNSLKAQNAIQRRELDKYADEVARFFGSYPERKGDYIE